MRCYVLIAIVVVVISVKNSEETDSIVIIHSYDGVPTKEKDFRNDKYKRKIESRKIANHHYYMHRNKPTATTKGDFWKEIENDLVKSSTVQPSLLTKDISTKTSYSHFFMKQPARISKGIFSHSHQPKHTFKRHSDNNGHMKHRFNREKVNRQRLKDLQANLTDSQQSVDSNNDQIDVFDFGNLPKEPLYQSENYSVPRTGPIRTRSTKNHSLEKKYSITDEIFLSAEVDKGGPFKKEKETKKDTENSTHALQLDKRRNNTTVASVQKRPTPSSNRNRYQQVARRRSDSTSEILIQRNDNWLKKTPLEEKHRNTTTTHKYDEVKTTTTPKNLSRRRQLKRPGVSNNNQKLIDDFYAKLNSELTPPKEETVQTITPLPNFSVTTHDDNIKFASNEGTSSIVEIVDLQPVDDKNLQHPDPKVLSNTKTLEEDHKLKVHTKPRHIRKKPPNEDTQDVFTTYTYPQGVLTQKHQDKDEEKNNHRHRSRKRKPERKDSTETANPFATKSDGDEEDEIEAFSKKHVVDLHVHRKQKPPPPSTHDDKKTDTESPRRTKPEENHHRSGYRIRKKKPPVYDMEEPQPTIQSKNDLADFTEQIKHNSHTKKHQLNEVESFVKNYEKELQSVRDKFSKQQNLDKEDEVTTTPRSRVRHKTDKKNGNFEDVAATNYDYGDFKPSQPLPVEFDEKPTPNGDGPKLKEADVDYFINFFKQHQQLQKNETKSVRGRKKQNHHQRGKQLQLETEGDGGTTPPPPKSPVTETTDGDTNKRRKNHRQRKPQIELDAETRRLNLFKNLKQDFPPKDTNQGQFGVDLFSGLNLEESKLLKALNENLQPLSSAKENSKTGEFPQQHNYDKEALTTNFFSVPNITFFKIDNPLIEATKISGGGGEHFKEVKSHVDKKLKEETDDLKEVYDKLQKATKNVQNFVNGAFPGHLQTSGDFVPVVPNEYLKQTENGQNKFYRGGNFRQQQKQQQGQSGGDEKQTNDYQQQLDLLNSIQQQNYPQQIGRPLNNTKPNRLNLKTTVFQNGLKTAQEILDINLFANLPAPPKQSTSTPEMINLESTEPKHTRNQPNQKLPEIFSVNLYTTSQENLNNEKTEPNVPLQTNDYNQYGLPTNVQNNQQNGSPIQDPVYQIITKPPVPVKQIVKPTPSTMYTSTKPTDANHRLNQPFNSRDLQDFLYKLNKSSPILIDNFQIVPVPPQTVVQKELQSISKQAEADLYSKLLNIKNADSVKVLTTPSSKVIVTTEDILKYYMEQPKQKGLDQMQIEELVKTAFPTEKDAGGQDFKYTLMDVGKKTTQPTEIYDLRKPPHNQLTYAQLEQLGIDLIKQNPNSNAFVVDSNGWTPLKTTEKTTTHNNNNVIMPLYNTLRQLGNNVKLSDLDLLQTWINENVIKENPPKTKTKKTEVVTKIIPKRNFTVTDTNVGNLPHLIPIDLSKIKITLPDKDPKKDTDLDEHYRKFLNQPYWNNDEVLLRNFLKHEQKDHSIGQRFGPEFAGFYNGEAWNDAIRPVKTVKDYMSKAKPKKSKERKGKVEENSKIDVVIKQKPEESSRRGGFDHVNLESLIRAYPMYTKLTGNTRQGYYVEELPEDTRPSKVFVRNTPRRGYMVEEVLDHR